MIRPEPNAILPNLFRSILIFLEPEQIFWKVTARGNTFAA
jgi:hypothetical protein